MVFHKTRRLVSNFLTRSESEFVENKETKTIPVKAKEEACDPPWLLYSSDAEVETLFRRLTTCCCLSSVLLMILRHFCEAWVHPADWVATSS
jgi:hypothetical protein